jgi:hypothetical protein
LGDEGSSISFLKRKVLRTEKGLALTPGTSAEKVVKSHEDYFGKIRAQMVPCDQSMQTEDLTDVLSPKDAFAYRSVVGVCLYLARDRPDLLFPVKELSGYMRKPTNGALQKLKKLMGYLKSTSDYCVVLEMSSLFQDRANGDQQISFGCLKASQTLTGLQSNGIVVQQVVEFTWCVVHLCMDLQDVKGSVSQFF